MASRILTRSRSFRRGGNTTTYANSNSVSGNSNGGRSSLYGFRGGNGGNLEPDPVMVEVRSAIQSVASILESKIGGKSWNGPDSSPTNSSSNTLSVGGTDSVSSYTSSAGGLKVQKSMKHQRRQERHTLLRLSKVLSDHGRILYKLPDADFEILCKIALASQIKKEQVEQIFSQLLLRVEDLARSDETVGRHRLQMRREWLIKLNERCGKETTSTAPNSITSQPSAMTKISHSDALRAQYAPKATIFDADESIDQRSVKQPRVIPFLEPPSLSGMDTITSSKETVISKGSSVEGSSITNGFIYDPATKTYFRDRIASEVSIDVEGVLLNGHVGDKKSWNPNESRIRTVSGRKTTRKKRNLLRGGCETIAVGGTPESNSTIDASVPTTSKMELGFSAKEERDPIKKIQSLLNSPLIPSLNDVAIPRSPSKSIPKFPTKNFRKCSLRSIGRVNRMKMKSVVKNWFRQPGRQSCSGQSNVNFSILSKVNYKPRTNYDHIFYRYVGRGSRKDPNLRHSNQESNSYVFDSIAKSGTGNSTEQSADNGIEKTRNVIKTPKKVFRKRIFPTKPEATRSGLRISYGIYSHNGRSWGNRRTRPNIVRTVNSTVVKSGVRKYLRRKLESIRLNARLNSIRLHPRSKHPCPRELAMYTSERFFSANKNESKLRPLHRMFASRRYKALVQKFKQQRIDHYNSLVKDYVWRFLAMQKKELSPLSWELLTAPERELWLTNHGYEHSNPESPYHVNNGIRKDRILKPFQSLEIIPEEKVMSSGDSDPTIGMINGGTIPGRIFHSTVRSTKESKNSLSENIGKRNVSEGKKNVTNVLGDLLNDVVKGETADLESLLESAVGKSPDLMVKMNASSEESLLEKFSENNGKILSGDLAKHLPKDVVDKMKGILKKKGLDVKDVYIVKVDGSHDLEKIKNSLDGFKIDSLFDGKAVQIIDVDNLLEDLEEDQLDTNLEWQFSSSLGRNLDTNLAEVASEAYETDPLLTEETAAEARELLQGPQRKDLIDHFDDMLEEEEGWKQLEEFHNKNFSKNGPSNGASDGNSFDNDGFSQRNSFDNEADNETGGFNRSGDNSLEKFLRNGNSISGNGSFGVKGGGPFDDNSRSSSGFFPSNTTSGGASGFPPGKSRKNESPSGDPNSLLNSKMEELMKESESWTITRGAHDTTSLPYTMESWLKSQKPNRQNIMAVNGGVWDAKYNNGGQKNQKNVVVGDRTIPRGDDVGNSLSKISAKNEGLQPRREPSAARRSGRSSSNPGTLSKLLSKSLDTPVFKRVSLSRSAIRSFEKRLKKERQSLQQEIIAKKKNLQQPPDEVNLQEMIANNKDASKDEIYKQINKVINNRGPVHTGGSGVIGDLLGSNAGRVTKDLRDDNRDGRTIEDTNRDGRIFSTTPPGQKGNVLGKYSITGVSENETSVSDNKSDHLNNKNDPLRNVNVISPQNPSRLSPESKTLNHNQVWTPRNPPPRNVKQQFGRAEWPEKLVAPVDQIVQRRMQENAEKIAKKLSDMSQKFRVDGSVGNEKMDRFSETPDSMVSTTRSKSSSNSNTIKKNTSNLESTSSIAQDSTFSGSSTSSRDVTENILSEPSLSETSSSRIFSKIQEASSNSETSVPSRTQCLSNTTGQTASSTLEQSLSDTSVETAPVDSTVESELLKSSGVESEMSQKEKSVEDVAKSTSEKSSHRTEDAVTSNQMEGDQLKLRETEANRDQLMRENTVSCTAPDAFTSCTSASTVDSTIGRLSAPSKRLSASPAQADSASSSSTSENDNLHLASFRHSLVRQWKGKSVGTLWQSLTEEALMLEDLESGKTENKVVSTLESERKINQRRLNEHIHHTLLKRDADLVSTACASRRLSPIQTEKAVGKFLSYLSAKDLELVGKCAEDLECVGDGTKSGFDRTNVGLRRVDNHVVASHSDHDFRGEFTMDSMVVHRELLRVLQACVKYNMVFQFFPLAQILGKMIVPTIKQIQNVDDHHRIQIVDNSIQLSILSKILDCSLTMTARTNARAARYRRGEEGTTPLISTNSQKIILDWIYAQIDNALKNQVVGIFGRNGVANLPLLQLPWEIWLGGILNQQIRQKLILEWTKVLKDVLLGESKIQSQQRQQEVSFEEEVKRLNAILAIMDITERQLLLGVEAKKAFYTEIAESYEAFVSSFGPNFGNTNFESFTWIAKVLSENGYSIFRGHSIFGGELSQKFSPTSIVDALEVAGKESCSARVITRWLSLMVKEENASLEVTSRDDHVVGRDTNKYGDKYGGVVGHGGVVRQDIDNIATARKTGEVAAYITDHIPALRKSIQQSSSEHQSCLCAFLLQQVSATQPVMQPATQQFKSKETTFETSVRSDGPETISSQSIDEQNLLSFLQEIELTFLNGEGFHTFLNGYVANPQKFERYLEAWERSGMEDLGWEYTQDVLKEWGVLDKLQNSTQNAQHSAAPFVEYKLPGFEGRSKLSQTSGNTRAARKVRLFTTALGKIELLLQLSKESRNNGLWLVRSEVTGVVAIDLGGEVPTLRCLARLDQFRSKYPSVDLKIRI